MSNPTDNSKRSALNKRPCVCGTVWVSFRKSWVCICDSFTESQYSRLSANYLRQIKESKDFFNDLKHFNLVSNNG